jgi:enoyl-CoA hydratase/carnithine racemase
VTDVAPIAGRVINADLDAGGSEIADAGPGDIVVGFSARPRQVDPPNRCDVLLATDPAWDAPWRDAPRPWIGVLPNGYDEVADALALACARNPIAASVAAQVLRVAEPLDFESALIVESLAYSALLAGDEFRAWREGRPSRKPPSEGPRVRLERRDRALVIALGRPEVRNAFDARMRDELTDALEFALADPDQAPVELTADGPAFSAGGDLDEFGRATDKALAHAIRIQQSPARLAHRLGERLTARVHGACIGAGIEVPAAAARLVAAPDTWFRLPEVSMGLIPGAGGTASIARRIGRHRTCFMAITGQDIHLGHALAWGLVDAVEPAP